MNANQKCKAIREVAESLGLPKYYAGDIEYDERVIRDPRFKDSEFLWVLRECGTSIMPLRMLVDENIILYYRGHSDAKVFHITKAGQVKEITWNRAEELATALPEIPATEAEILQGLKSMLNGGSLFLFNKPACETLEEWRNWLEVNTSNTVAPRYIRACLKRLTNAQAA